jgi:hypothetical protein
MTALHLAALAVLYVLLAIGSWTALVEGCRAYGRWRRKHRRPVPPPGYRYGSGVRSVQTSRPYEWNEGAR